MSCSVCRFEKDGVSKSKKPLPLKGPIKLISTNIVDLCCIFTVTEDVSSQMGN